MLSDPPDRFLLTILTGLADLERANILERTTQGAYRVAKEGKWLGGNPPYGYKVNSEGFLEISGEPLLNSNLTEADVVRLIYKLLVEQKYSSMKIADYLNTLKIPTAYIKDNKNIKKVKTNGLWRPTSVIRIITDIIYKGIHIYGKRSKRQKEAVYRKVPSMIDEETWEKAQKILKENKKESKRNSKRQYLLRGLIKCGIGVTVKIFLQDG